MAGPPAGPTLFPYTTLFRSLRKPLERGLQAATDTHHGLRLGHKPKRLGTRQCDRDKAHPCRSEEHTSELQSHHEIVCRLLLEKKKSTRWPSSTGVIPFARSF